MMPLGCLGQLYCECLDIVTKNKVLTLFNRQSVDVLVYLQKRLPDVVGQVGGYSRVDHDRSTLAIRNSKLNEKGDSLGRRPVESMFFVQPSANNDEAMGK